ncbi:MAG: hypothetical protein GY862_39295 [Gammaproteobacteria bacterium]|nr:hypothetical protein [Gammaproteobacteria bacterium]
MNTIVRLFFVMGMTAFVIVTDAQAFGALLINAGGKCLDVNSPDLYTDGGKVRIWDCTDAPNQQWRLDNRRLRNAGGRCLDVNGPDMNKTGGKVQIWRCNITPNQKWRFSNGRLMNDGGKCLDVNGPDLHKTGGKVQIWDCNNTQNQQWSLTSLIDRKRVFVPAASPANSGANPFFGSANRQSGAGGMPNQTASNRNPFFGSANRQSGAGSTPNQTASNRNPFLGMHNSAQPVSSPLTSTLMGTHPFFKRPAPQPVQQIPLASTAHAVHPQYQAAIQDTSVPAPASDTPRNEPAPFTGIVAMHNGWRQKIGVPNLKWSKELAKYAQAWADQLKSKNCQMKHRSGASRSRAYGENLAWGSGFMLTAERAVNMWAGEIANYNYANNTCKPGKVCGHYTQVVWKSTSQVGCGMASCGSSSIWVCNYNPPGNYIGRKPW